MKTKISFILLAFSLIVGCQQQNSKIKKGMVKVTILYANGEGKTFDMDYYANKHIPMAASLMGDDLKAMEIDKGIANSAPDMPIQYLAIGYLYFDNMDAFKNAMGTNSAKLKADIPNFTNITPTIQISEVQTAP